MRKDRAFAGSDWKNRDIRRIGPSAQPLSCPVPVRQINAGLLLITLILVCFGLVMLFSASMTDAYAKSGNALFYVIKQAGITGAGLLAALFIALMLPIRLFDHFWMTLAAYGVTTALLVYVKFFGILMNGARRWVNLGIQFQPSELAKVTMVFCFAGYCSWLRRLRKTGHLKARTPLGQFLLDGWLDILLPGLALFVWIGLILWQPHLSCAIIMTFIAGVLFLTAGIRLRSWVSAFTQVLVMVAALVAAGTLILSVMPGDRLQQQVQTAISENFAHVQDRLDTFTNPEEASSDDLYQINQSLIAIGSGGLSGIGIGEGRQKYNYLPEAHNDYVFAIIGEELGFGGTTAVLLLFVLFMLLGVSITRQAGSTFSALLAGGYTMLISIQALLNIAVATHTIPATGISLPFFSYGGTANLFFLLAIGFILAVSRTGQRPARQLAGQTHQTRPEAAVPIPLRPDAARSERYHPAGPSALPVRPAHSARAGD